MNNNENSKTFAKPKKNFKIENNNNQRHRHKVGKKEACKAVHLDKQVNV